MQKKTSDLTVANEKIQNAINKLEEAYNAFEDAKPFLINQNIGNINDIYHYISELQRQKRLLDPKWIG